MAGSGYNQVIHHDEIASGAGRAGTVGGHSEGYDFWSVHVQGTFEATVNFEGTVDGENWFEVGMYPYSDPTAAPVTSTAAAGAWWAFVPGVRKVRANVGSFVSNTSGRIVGGLSA